MRTACSSIASALRKMPFAAKRSARHGLQAYHTTFAHRSLWCLAMRTKSCIWCQTAPIRIVQDIRVSIYNCSSSSEILTRMSYFSSMFLFRISQIVSRITAGSRIFSFFQLPLVRQIVDFHHWSVHFYNHKSGGFCCKIVIDTLERNFQHVAGKVLPHRTIFHDFLDAKVIL